MLSQEFINKMKNKLEAEKEQVEKKIDDLTKPEQPMDNPDAEDIAQDAAEDILEDSLLTVHKKILNRINEALDRIANKTYGICLACGAEIKEEDLAKEPWAEHCRVCNPR
jgi:DnaK suppressor protein